MLVGVWQRQGKRELLFKDRRPQRGSTLVEDNDVVDVA
jgi:hypothetical protein